MSPIPARARPGANNEIETLKTEIESLKARIEELEKAVGAIIDAIPGVEDQINYAILAEGEYLGRKFE